MKEFKDFLYESVKVDNLKGNSKRIIITVPDGRFKLLAFDDGTISVEINGQELELPVEDAKALIKLCKSI